jgi:PST family polysaccharide transporter
VKAAPVLATIMITSYVIGLPYGPKGVAFAYSAALTLWLIPHITWAVHRTPISLWDVLLTVSRPLASSILAGGPAFAVHVICTQSVSPLPRLVLETSTLFVAYFATLLFAVGQKSLYLDLLRDLKGPPASPGPTNLDTGPIQPRETLN